MSHYEESPSPLGDLEHELLTILWAADALAGFQFLPREKEEQLR
jgi:hypothetical protein